MANTEKLQEALQDQKFVEELFALETPEEAKAKLQEKGVEITVEELKAVMAYVSKSASGELSEDDLEDVAGGAILNDMMNIMSPVLDILKKTVVKVIRRW